MPARRVSPLLQPFVDEELVRAPLLFDQVAAGAAEQARRRLPAVSEAERRVVGELLEALQAQRARLAERFAQSLTEQVQTELARDTPRDTLPPPAAPRTLALVEEDAVALEVELSHTVQLTRNTAEHELRELQSFIAALRGDLDLAEDHNPFRPEVFAKALWASAQALPLTRGHRIAFVRHASAPLAQTLRQAYAAASTRLESMGVEPATYRTVVGGGSRRSGAGPVTTFSPDLQRMRDAMGAAGDGGGAALAYEGQIPEGGMRELWLDVARSAGNRVDRQSIELVSRLFDAIRLDERVPQDVIAIVARLHGPAMRLTLRDPSVLDKNQHPLWRFIHLLAYEAEMAPDPSDPERARLLRLAQQIVERLVAETEQRPTLYRRALERVEEFLRQRLERRCATLASQIGALQKFDADGSAASTMPGALDGVLDAPALDTVPGDLVAGTGAAPDAAAAGAWLDALRTGHWVRMLIQGRWVAAQLLWRGAQREIYLFGDGASDATWAVRRGALLLMHAGGLAKSLKMRSLVGSAAARVQQQVAPAQAPAAS